MGSGLRIFDTSGGGRSADWWSRPSPMVRAALLVGVPAVAFLAVARSRTTSGGVIAGSGEPIAGDVAGVVNELAAMFGEQVNIFQEQTAAQIGQIEGQIEGLRQDVDRQEWSQAPTTQPPAPVEPAPAPAPAPPVLAPAPSPSPVTASPSPMQALDPVRTELRQLSRGLPAAAETAGANEFVRRLVAGDEQAARRVAQQLITGLPAAEETNAINALIRKARAALGR